MSAKKAKARKPAANAATFLEAKRLHVLKVYHKARLHLEASGLYDCGKALDTALHMASNKMFRNFVAEAGKHWGTNEIQEALDALGIREHSTPTWQEYEDYKKTLVKDKKD